MLCMAYFFLLTIYLNYTQLVSSMNNMQMEVVLHKGNNTYVCTYVMHGIAYPVSPCNIKGCIIISLTFIHSTKHPE